MSLFGGPFVNGLWFLTRTLVLDKLMSSHPPQHADGTITEHAPGHVHHALLKNEKVAPLGPLVEECGHF